MIFVNQYSNFSRHESTFYFYVRQKEINKFSAMVHQGITEMMDFDDGLAVSLAISLLKWYGNRVHLEGIKKLSNLK